MVVKFRQMYMAVDTLSCIQTHFYAQKCYSVYSYSVTIYIAEKIVNSYEFFFFVQAILLKENSHIFLSSTHSLSKNIACLSKEISSGTEQIARSSKQLVRPNRTQIYLNKYLVLPTTNSN